MKRKPILAVLSIIAVATTWTIYDLIFGTLNSSPTLSCIGGIIFYYLVLNFLEEQK